MIILSITMGTVPHTVAEPMCCQQTDNTSIRTEKGAGGAVSVSEGSADSRCFLFLARTRTSIINGTRARGAFDRSDCLHLFLEGARKDVVRIYYLLSMGEGGRIDGDKEKLWWLYW